MAWIVPAHRRIVRKEVFGWGPASVRAILRGLAVPYSAAVRCRRYAYRLGWLRSHPPTIPVVSIGNLTTGGVGKTPFVQTVVRWLSSAGRSPVVVSRGYKSNGAANDESLMLKENLPGVLQLQNPDRVAAVRQVVERRLGDAVVLDDGFQHLRLRRTIDLVLLDATDPFGCERLLPAGFLREPISTLGSADAVVLTRSSLVSRQERDSIKRRVAKSTTTALWAEIDFEPTAWSRFGHEPEPLAALKGNRVLAFCGIGNPAAFRKTLDEVAVKTIALEAFPDHHWYNSSELERLAAKARMMGADALVATQKDAVKIPQPDIDGVPLYSLRIETRFRCGEDGLRQLVVDRVAGFEVG